MLLAFAIVFWMLVNVPVPAEPGNPAHASAGGSRTFVIGAVDFAGSIATLSPFRATSTPEMMSIWPCMSTLLTYDPDGNLIGDLAESWSLSADGLTWSFRLQPNLYFTDPATPSSKTHQLTWLDVQYSYFQAQNSSNQLQSYFLFADQGIIQEISGSANYVNITLAGPFAPFVEALTFVPIIPKYYWEPHEDLAGDATWWEGAPPIGSGPWYYSLPGLPVTGEVVLQRSPIWFQEADRGWQVHVSTLKYRTEYDPVSAWNNLKTGLTDLMIGVPSSTYADELPLKPSLTGWAQGNGFVYEYNLCQMTDDMRTNPPYDTGTNSQILQDPVVRRAMAMAVDKQAFVDEVLDGFGSPADSLVPLDNPWHYSPQNQVSFDLAGANALLESNGYVDTDHDGVRECTASSPAVVAGWATESSELSFRFVALTPETEYAIGAGLIRDWTAQIGIKLNLTLWSIGPMSNIWMRADYDTWLWSWMFSPIGDPSDIMQVLTTSAIGTWSDLYWSNETYDRIYNESMVQMDPVARRQLVDQLQQMAYDNMGSQLVAYAKTLYAANCSRWISPSFAGCGSKVTLSPELCYPWLYMQLSPANNPPPTVSAGQDIYDCLAGEESEFTGTATDSSPLEYQWFWGDGTSTGWTTSSSAAHAYSDGGYYTAYFAAREVGTDDGFISWDQASVAVYDVTNLPPTGLSFTVTPPQPTALSQATFDGSATDSEGDPMSFHWDFGDSTTGYGVHVQHTYQSPGTYSVTMSVTDNQPGPGRPSSFTKSVVVVLVNSPPTITVPAYPEVVQSVATLFSVNASDVNGDTLRFTWLWGDGGMSVTTTPSAVHTYTQKKTRTLTVYADDLTGEGGHNVSGSNSVTVAPLNAEPTIVNFTASPVSALSGEPVTFTGSAMCANGGSLRFTFSFGDMSYGIVNTGSLYGLEVATVTVAHAYSTTGTVLAGLAVLSPQLLNVSSAPIMIEVSGSEDPPLVSPPEPVTGVAGQSVAFSADAFDPDDPVLRYTWDFGDGSVLHVGNPVEHTYQIPGNFTYTVHVDDLSGVPGHNVSATSWAKIGFRLILQEGWNLISIPLERTFYAGSLGLSSGDLVVQYNSATMAYVTYVVGMPLNNFTMVKGQGYWIYSATQKSITLYGDHPTGTQTITVDVPAGGGWALLGFCWAAGVPASQFTTRVAVTGGSVMQIVRYNPWPYEVYQTYVVGMPLNSFTMVSGEAYWLWVTNDCVMTYDPDPGPIILP